MSLKAEHIGVLRPMQNGDLEMVLTWRNAPEVRNNMYTQQIIALGDHKSWWARVKDSERSQYLIFEMNGKPMGLVNFTCIDRVRKFAFWGFYTHPHAPKGTGSHLGFAALDFAFESLGLKVLEGEVLAHNVASQTFHKKLGFQEIEFLAANKEIDGALQGVYRFAIEAADWAKYRSKRLQYLEGRCRDAP